METITRDDLRQFFGWRWYQKRRLTKAVRVRGPFRVETPEGTLECPDGYLAKDSRGWPYPIAKEEFEEIYEDVGPVE